MSRGRSRAALRKIKRQGGSRPGQTRSNLYRKLRRKLRDIIKSRRKPEEVRKQSRDDDILDAIDERK